ncbi:hypothetical protein HDR63_03660 [bacterium]|nr:hypothetical protein [bacterium]
MPNPNVGLFAASAWAAAEHCTFTEIGAPDGVTESTTTPSGSGIPGNFIASFECESDSDDQTGAYTSVSCREVEFHTLCHSTAATGGEAELYTLPGPSDGPYCYCQLYKAMDRTTRNTWRYASVSNTTSATLTSGHTPFASAAKCSEGCNDLCYQRMQQISHLASDWLLDMLNH